LKFPIIQLNVNSHFRFHLSNHRSKLKA